MSVAAVPSAFSLRRSDAGTAEILLFAVTLVMATGPLDQLIQRGILTDPERAVIWAAIYAGFALTLFMRPRLLGQAVGQAWPMFLLPALAALSITWSDAPMQSLSGTIEFGAAILFGAIIGARLDERRLLLLVLLGLTALAVVDIPMTLSPLGTDINDDAVGLFSHKNIHGQMASILVLSSLAVLLWGGRRWLAVTGFALGVPLLALTGSRGAWTMTAAAAGVMLLVVFRRLAPPARLSLAFLGVALVCGLAIAWSAAQLDLESFMLNTMGKDPTLTGRTMLWELAAGYIDRAPLLGHGFAGFWSEDITSDSAFVNSVLGQELQSFHNGYLEMAVELGWIGCTLAVALLLAFLKPVARLLSYGDPAAAAFALALLTVVVVGSMSEVMMFVRHGFHLMLMAALWSRSSAYAPSIPTPRSTIPSWTTPRSMRN